MQLCSKQHVCMIEKTSKTFKGQPEKLLAHPSSGCDLKDKNKEQRSCASPISRRETEFLEEEPDTGR